LHVNATTVQVCPNNYTHSKFTPEQDMKAQRGVEVYSSTFSLTSALDGGGGGQCHALANGGGQGQSGWVEIISPPPGFNPRTIQPVVSRYTDS
jgi:hypothetical protein